MLIVLQLAYLRRFSAGAGDGVGVRARRAAGAVRGVLREDVRAAAAPEVTIQGPNV